MSLSGTTDGEPPKAIFNVSGNTLTGNHGLIACNDESLMLQALGSFQINLTFLGNRIFLAMKN